MTDRIALLLVSVAMLSAACSGPAPEPAPATQAADPTPEPLPEPSPPPPPAPAATPTRDADGCVTIQLPGHFEGDGLAKHYVPGPTTRLCDPPAVIAPATAEPYAPPIAATPAD